MAPATQVQTCSSDNAVARRSRSTFVYPSAATRAVSNITRPASICAGSTAAGPPARTCAITGIAKFSFQSRPASAAAWAAPDDLVVAPVRRGLRRQGPERQVVGGGAVVRLERDLIAREREPPHGRLGVDAAWM